MSKYVKNLLTDHFRGRLEGVKDAIVVNVVGLSANKTNQLRGELEAKDIRLIVIKNSLAARASLGTTLEPALKGLKGSAALCFGGEDIVSLAKEVIRLQTDGAYAPFEARGGAMEGEALTAEQVKQVSKWPNRDEQLSLLVGQILGPGATLAAQILGPGATLAGQVKQKAEEDGE